MKCPKFLHKIGSEYDDDLIDLTFETQKLVKNCEYLVQFEKLLTKCDNNGFILEHQIHSYACSLKFSDIFPSIVRKDVFAI